MEGGTRQAYYRRHHDKRAEKDLSPRQHNVAHVNAVTVERTATAPAPVVTVVGQATDTGLATLKSNGAAATTTGTGYTSVETVNGGIFTIVVQQVAPSAAATSATNSTFSNPFFTLPSLTSTTTRGQTTTTQVIVVGSSGGGTLAAASTGVIYNPTINNSQAGGLSTGAIVGIAIGSFAAVVLALALLFWAFSAYRDRRAREEVTDMMGTSNLPDPYAGAFISREVPGSFVRFNDDDDLSVAGGAAGERPHSYGGAGPNAYDDLSMPDEDYVDVGSGGNRPLSPFRGSRAYTGTY